MTTESRTIEFHRTFGHPVRTEPQALSREEAILAFGLIEEELRELAEALFPGVTDDPECRPLTAAIHHYSPDLVAVADALGDLDVVVNGAGIRHGFDMQAISREVFRSNMSKLGEDGKPIFRADGKILKGPGFTEPALATVLGIEVAE